jgi:hypothetical protein
VLEKIDKGVSVVQLVEVLQGFYAAGIGAHGYLMYGFPGETVQDTVNGLEVVRQLMASGLLQSGFFHQLSVTAHAPLGRNPKLFNIRLREREGSGFARNQLPFAYQDGVHRTEAVLEALSAAMDCYQRGVHLQSSVEMWFKGMPMPRPTVPPTFVADVVEEQAHSGARERSRLCWLGGLPQWTRGQITVRGGDGVVYTRTAPQWLAENIRRCHPDAWVDGKPPTRKDFESHEWIEGLRSMGLVAV